MPRESAECQALVAERKRLLNLMWKSTIFSKKRKEYERRANEVARELKACRKGQKGKGKGKKGGKGKDGKKSAMQVFGTPERLWATDPTQRPVGGFGVVSSIMHAGFEDALHAIARGARTSVAARPVDDRATIRGGLAALKLAGEDVPDSSRFKSGITAKPKNDRALAKAAGASNVRDGAEKMRKRIIRAKLERAAWAARGLYLLENTKLISANKELASGILTAIPNPITMIIGLSVGTHAKIAKANIEKTAKEFAAMFKEEAQKRAGGPEGSEAPEGASTLPARRGILPDLPPRSWLWVGLGVVGVVIVGAVASGRRESA